MIFILVIVLGLLIAVYFLLNNYKGRGIELPSALYINRPKDSDVRPWGCDGKEGVDIHADEIAGGGLFVSLHKWK